MNNDMNQQPHARSRVCLVGASPDSGRVGVLALCHATVAGLARRGVEEIVVFDQSVGERRGSLASEVGPLPVTFVGATDNQHYLDSNNLWNIRVSSKLGGLLNPAAQAIRNADAVLDVSCGDQFTDLYGSGKFKATILPKITAIEAGKPLILLPQTFGPFENKGLTAKARFVLQHATQVWARDHQSYQTLQQLLGSDFDPHIHKEGVDMAFGLAPMEPEPTIDWLNHWVSEKSTRPIAGVNVSGILSTHNQSTDRIHLKSDYTKTIRAIVQWLLDQTNARILLLPQVTVSTADTLTDQAASRALLKELTIDDPSRVRVIESVRHPAQMKWIIGQCDWFTGSTMHGAIAAVSQDTPASPLAFSDKFAGVFARCQQAHAVIDLRSESLEAVVEAVKSQWNNRQNTRLALAEPIQQIKRRWSEQLDEIALIQTHKS